MNNRYADWLSQDLYNSTCNTYVYIYQLINIPSSYFPEPTNSGCFSTSYVFGGSAKKQVINHQ